MGLKVEFDVDSIIQKIRAVGRDANKEAFVAMRETGREIRDQAREYAPIDDGDLERAIKLQSKQGENVIYVGIDPSMSDHLGRPISGYGQMMHEFQGIGGSGGHFGLGPRSQRKDGGRGVVGGKFLERATKEKLVDLLKNAAIAVKRVTRS